MHQRIRYGTAAAVVNATEGGTHLGSWINPAVADHYPLNVHHQPTLFASSDQPTQQEHQNRLKGPKHACVCMGLYHTKQIKGPKYACVCMGLYQTN